MNPEIPQSVLDKINEEAEKTYPITDAPNFNYLRQPAYKAGRLKTIEEIEKLEKVEANQQELWQRVYNDTPHIIYATEMIEYISKNFLLTPINHARNKQTN